MNPELQPLFLGIEGGATHTVALLSQGKGQLLNRLVAGPGNIRLLDDQQLLELLQEIGEVMPSATALAIGMAGARTEDEWGRMRAAAAKVWRGIPCYATNDLETALAAADEVELAFKARVLVLSGTGSCLYGRSSTGQTAKVGGWGHVLGDQGSAYDIGRCALQGALEFYDHTGRWPPLGQRILRALQLNAPDDLVGWAHAAQKTDFAALAPEVFAAQSRNEKIAQAALAAAATRLAQDAVACARRLAAHGQRVQFILSGGVLLKQPAFAQKVARELRRRWPMAVVTPLLRESAWGAVELARTHYGSSGKPVVSHMHRQPRIQHANVTDKEVLDASDSTAELRALELSPTEQRNPRSLNLDRLSLGEAIKLMLSEDAKIPKALLAERHHIERTIRLAVGAFRKGGRLFYVGAGTSGRLGVLDASECPPTFCSPPDQVQGIMAGGARALWDSVEGAEDDAAAGARAIASRGVGRLDVVVGIAASGRTPFVWGALAAAKQSGAATVLLTFNPGVRIPPDQRPNVVIAPNVGPEVLTGSTRLKAGTATKLVLNILTTLAMVRLGKVASNLMIDLNPSNAKLRSRAVRILRDLASVDEASARAALEQTGWVVRKAWKAISRRHPRKTKSGKPLGSW